MDVVEIIRRKRDGHANSAEEIGFLVRGASSDSIARYQLSAWLMAVYWRGMSAAEVRHLTASLVASGQRLDFSGIPVAKVDKHSTGGVGDKTSLVIAPIVAAAGLAVPMVSGRGLGHTGGTLDKLESIPGFRVGLTLDDFRVQVRDIGLSLIGQTDDLDPGDRALYSLRDVTATVESIPLIVASIISKKVVEGIDALVLDVKTGSGAFMKSLEDSRSLALALVDAGRRQGLAVRALITDMSQPLGRMVGNALEVIECIDVLRGDGPPDLAQLCLSLSAHMLAAGGKTDDLDEAEEIARRQIDSGAALRKFERLIQAQGGDPSCLDDRSLFPQAKATSNLTAEASGFLQEADALRIGRAAMILGAGRRDAESVIDRAVGIELAKKTGDPIAEGETLAKLHYNQEAALREALPEVQAAFRIGGRRRQPPPLIHEVIL